MLNDPELAHWAQHCGIGPEALAIVRAVRASPPRRRVRSGRKNVPGAYPSRKMGQTIQFESHTVELPFVYLFEHDPDVLEFWDQPAVPVTMRYQHRAGEGGRRIGVLHTADFFVLTTNGAGWRECKSERELARLATTSPDRYQLGEAGWRSAPGETFARSYGLSYLVCSTGALNPVLIENLKLLSDYLNEPLPVEPGIAAAVSAAVRTSPGISLERLRAASEASADDLYALIANNVLHVDLEGTALATARAGVYVSAEQARAVVQVSAFDGVVPDQGRSEIASGDVVDWDGSNWEVINVGESATTLRHTTAAGSSLQRLTRAEVDALRTRGALRTTEGSAALPVADALLNASPQAIAIANDRWRVVEASLAGRPVLESIPERTLARWKASVRAAHAAGLPGYDALLPNCRPGNRTPRLDPRVEEVIAELLTTTYEQPLAPSAGALFARIAAACAARGLPLPSPKAVRRRIRARAGHRQTTQRHGHRRAYGGEPFVWELSANGPRHGSRPFEIAHLDHTQVDAEVLDSDSGRALGRPWLTIMSDAYSRMPLAVWLAFDPPSYRACMMAVRICVARHERLPDALVLDGGREFRSEYFEKLLARCGVTAKRRPAAKPRYGSVLERLFGAANTQLVHQLAGNTKATRNVRQLTTEVDPRRLAAWSMADLYALLCRWAYEFYPSLEHPALGAVPQDVFLVGLERHGARPQRRIAYDESFRFATLPTTAKGTAKVDSVRGVRVNYGWYWSEAFARPRVAGTSVPVRFDPFDARHVYAFVDARWLECFSLELGGLGPVSTSEVLIASAELRQRRSRHAAGATHRAIQLGQFLASTDADSLLSQQRRRDQATRTALAGSGTVPAQTDCDQPATEWVRDRELHFLPPAGPLPTVPVYDEYK